MAAHLEIEAKYLLTEPPPAFRVRVAARCPDAPTRETHEDRYFAAPDRDFARTDEALRLRVRGTDAALTYKGPKLDATTKTRREVEIPLAAAHAPHAQELLAALGFRVAATVRKIRDTWRMAHGGREFAVCLDEVAGLPPYVELETTAPAEELEAARGALLALAAELGFAGPAERRGYVELLHPRGPAVDHAALPAGAAPDRTS